jgi:hypothetical protein
MGTWEGLTSGVNRDTPFSADLERMQDAPVDHPHDGVALDLEIFSQSLHRGERVWMDREILNGLIDEAMAASTHAARIISSTSA